MLFSLLKHYLDTDTALKVSQSVYCFTTSISHGVENYFPRLWGTGISDAIFASLHPLLEHTWPICKYPGTQYKHLYLITNKIHTSKVHKPIWTPLLEASELFFFLVIIFLSKGAQLVLCVIFSLLSLQYTSNLQLRYVWNKVA